MATSREPHVTLVEEREELEHSLRFLNPHFSHETFPWVQVGGYAGSLALTAAALWLVVSRHLPPIVLFAALVTLASLQAILQLGTFMHLRESRGTAWQILGLALVLGIAIGVVITAVWIMAFKWGTA
jgi:cytochrome aa3-600 menaquinol oxidase subunit 4